MPFGFLMPSMFTQERTASAIDYTIIVERCPAHDVDTLVLGNEVTRFVLTQHARMPDFLRPVIELRRSEQFPIRDPGCTIPPDRKTQLACGQSRPAAQELKTMCKRSTV